MARTTVAALFAVALIAVLRPSVAERQVSSEAERPAPRFTGESKSVLYVSDVEEAAPFYRDVLGFELLNYTDGADGEPYYAEMSAGGLKFGLHDPMNDEQATWVGHQRLYFRVEGIRELHAKLVEAGVSPGALRETTWMDMVVVRDPDGHQIVFAETDSARHTVDPW